MVLDRWIVLMSGHAKARHVRCVLRPAGLDRSCLDNPDAPSSTAVLEPGLRNPDALSLTALTHLMPSGPQRCLAVVYGFFVTARQSSPSRESGNHGESGWFVESRPYECRLPQRTAGCTHC